MNGRFLRVFEGLILGLALALSPAPVRAEQAVPPGDVFLTLGQGWAVVREARAADLDAGEQVIVLEDMPLEADLSSLVLSSARWPVALLEWAREPGESDGTAPGRAAPETGDVTWTPADHASGLGLPPASRRVRCTVRAPAGGRGLPLRVSYAVRGFSWAAHYQVAVRGEQTGETGPVSVDLSGLITIRNPTRRVFSNATIRLVGAPDIPARDYRADPGFLVLDEESALSDLWLETPAEPDVQYAYSIPQKVTLGGQTDVDVPIVDIERTAATWLYALRSEDVPLDGPAEGVALRRWIVFRNVPVGPAGVDLPPGLVSVFLGGMRTHLLQEARFERVPANGEIRIDLGLAEDVRGARKSQGRSTSLAGETEETYLVVVRNLRANRIRAEVDERPPPSTEWTVISSTKPFEERQRHLFFTVEAEPGGTERIEYRLRVREPEVLGSAGP